MRVKFERLIRKYADQYTALIKQEGHFDGGDWVDGSTNEVTINAAVFPVTAEDVRNYEGLGYTTKDIKIFVPEDEQQLNRDDTFKYSGNKYRIDTIADRRIHSDFVKYIAVREQEGDDT